VVCSELDGPDPLPHLLRRQEVEIVLAFSTIPDQPGPAEQPKVMAGGWLGLTEGLAELRDGQFALLIQQDKDTEPGSISEHLEDLDCAGQR